MKRLSFIIAILAASGCPAVHTMRTAEVLKPGETQMVVHTGMNGALLVGSATVEGEGDSAGVGFMVPWAVASYRVGVVDRLDFQIKSDVTLLPELSLGYQLIGTPGEGGLAASAVVGMRWLTFGGATTEGSGDSTSLIYLPVTGMVDLPLGSNKVFLRGGTMVIAGGGETYVRPMVGLGATVKLGELTLMPEIDYMHVAGGSVEEEDVSASVNLSLLAFGLGFAF